VIDASKQLFYDNLKRNNGATDRALAETIQSIAMLGISRTDFFTKAAFYGGTALRMLYGLDRFSEDLDFSLIKTGLENFKFDSYFNAVADELEAFGFNVDINLKVKKIISPIESAFIKANTRVHVLQAGVPDVIASTIHRNAVCKVKIEIDTDPPGGAEYDVSYIDDPVPFTVKTYSPSALFAGKMDAMLSRGWLKRVKGRDWYDFAFFVRKKIPLLLGHLEERLRQKKIYTSGNQLTEDEFKLMLNERIKTVNLEAAKQDVSPFLRDPREVDIWSIDYFSHVMNNILIR